MLDQTAIISLVGAAAAVSGVAFGYLGYQKGVRRESRQAGSVEGERKADLEYIKHRTDDILLEQKDTNKSINALAERVTRVEESTKSAHKRLDLIEEKGV